MIQTDNCADGEVCEGYSEVLELVHEINKKFEKMQRRGIQEDLTPAQYLLLRQLWETDSLQFKDLAIACNCSRSTVTGVVDTMEKKGLVKRVAHPKDRRSTLVKLTKKGKELKESTPSLDSLTNNCCQGIDSDELRILTILLKRLSSSLTV
ncbi:hypothetical protein LCGC14_1162990 [marine sediment metagenome]|uniref:HTH marR-type domain-containing protein n=1 Tax=marine sediment metagenome TaxID=412755 RepID=A0A0F9MF57_9ZZZZ|nr:MAG: Transcriptional activatory protein BadR [Candidatus Lokiarchaeum sp. GC14_75]